MSYFTTDGIAEYGSAAVVATTQVPPQRPAAQIRAGRLNPTALARVVSRAGTRMGHAHESLGAVVWGGSRPGRESLGACCSSCAHSDPGVLGALGALGAVTQAALSRFLPSTTPNTRLPPPPPDPGRGPTQFVAPPPPPPGFPGAPAVGGMSPIVKLAIIAGVGVGGFLLIKRLRARKTA